MSNQIKGIPAILEKYSSRKGDKSILLTFATNEITAEEKLFIFDQNEKYVNLVIIPADKVATIEDVSEALPDPQRFTTKNGKSDSEVFRNTLFKLFMKKGGKKEDFEEYRHEIMQGLINHYNKKAEEL